MDGDFCAAEVSGMRRRRARFGISTISVTFLPAFGGTFVHIESEGGEKSDVFPVKNFQMYG